MKYSTILFDFDGTLVDSATFVHEYSIDFIRAHGLEGHDPEKIFWDLNNDISDLNQELKTAYWQGFREQEPEKTQLFPGLKEVLDILKAKKVKTGVVTNRRKVRVEEVLLKKDVAKYFDAIIGIEEVENRKPYAEPVLKALEILGGVPEASLYIGNSQEDIESGLNAGVQTIFFKESPIYYEMIKDWLSENKPLAIISSYRDLLPYIE